MILSGPRGLGEIDFAGFEPGPQFLRGQVHQFEFRAVQHGVRQGLADGHAGYLMDGFGPALDMLDIERGKDINPRIENLEHILITFGMARAGRIGMRKFVHQG